MAEILERGAIYFLYRPRGKGAAGIEDLDRLYLVLSPHGDTRHRFLRIAGERLPQIGEEGEAGWALVERVFHQREETRAALNGGDPYPRPAGEGVYALLTHEDRTHLAYALELPQRLGAVQSALQIRPQGSFVVSILNPREPSPSGTGLQPREAIFPAELQARFGSKSFLDLEAPVFLDQEGAGLMLFGAAQDVYRELGLDLDPRDEGEMTPAIFKDLAIDRSRCYVEPLLQGEWR